MLNRMHEFEGSPGLNGHAESVEGSGGALWPAEAEGLTTWHALYTRHQHEKTTARILAHKGFEIFLPVYSATHRWKDRMKKLSLPLFPCYVFVHGGLDRRLDILNTPGVHSLVRVGDQIAVIPEQEIQAIRRVVACSVQAEPYPYLKCGDRVRVVAGPLAGVEGILVRKKDQFRLILSVELLHRSIALEVDEALVEAVQKNRNRREFAMPAVSPAFA